MYSFMSFLVGLSLLIDGKSDFFKMANLLDFDEPCAIFTSKNYVSNSVTFLPATIKDGYAYLLLNLSFKITFEEPSL